MSCEVLSDSSLMTFPFSLSTLRSSATAPILRSSSATENGEDGRPFCPVNIQCPTGRSFTLQIILIQTSKVKQVAISLIHHQGVFHTTPADKSAKKPRINLPFDRFLLYTLHLIPNAVLLTHGPGYID
jgi:hypothetical protein